MYSVMALFDSELRAEVFLLLELAGISHYTQFTGLYGSSENGKKEGSVAWPGYNEILMCLVTAEQKLRFNQVVRDYKKERERKPGLLVFAWQLESFE